jgi:integrase
VNITKNAVDKIQIPVLSEKSKTNQKRYYDDKLKGFGLRVTSGGTKAFFVEKLVKGKLSRITIGRYGELTVEQARKEAQVVLGQIARGFDPIAEKRLSKVKKITLNEVFKDYIQARKSLKPKTLYDYKRLLDIAFASWGDKPLLSITKDKIAKKHENLGKERGEAYANLAMRILRALFNFASGQYEDSNGNSLINDNPVRRLSQTRAWYRVERRKTFIKPNELGPWFKSVQNITNQTLQDYLIFILFTGLRRQEAAKLRWDQVDLVNKTLKISDTKNNEAHVLPLSDYLLTLLNRRKQGGINDFVFPGSGSGGYIIEPRKQMLKASLESGITFTVHDLRRTFLTIAEGLDIPAYALKRLVNHKMSNDVTAGYIMLDVERLRKPMQLITDHMLKLVGVKITTVIELDEVKKELITANNY